MFLLRHTVVIRSLFAESSVAVPTIYNS